MSVGKESPMTGHNMESHTAQHTGTISSIEENDLSAPEPSNGAPHSKRERVKALITKTRGKVKDVVSSPVNVTKPSEYGDHYHDNDNDDDDDDLFADPAFSPEHVVKELTKDDRKTKEKVGDGLKSVAKAIIHPRSTIPQATHSTAGQLSTNPKTYLSTEQDHELVDAQDALDDARSRPGLNDNADVQGAREKVDEIEEQRASRRTAWSLGRHADRVRVVLRNRPMPRREDYVTRDASDGRSKFDRNMWLIALVEWYTQRFTAHHIEDVRFVDDLPFDIQDLARSIEQLAMVSAPWQAFFIDVRNIYLWEDPKRTMKWMTLYFTLWYTETIVGYLFFVLIYGTVRNKYWPTSVESIRDSLNRGVEREAQAQAWGELIQRHGKHDWVEPLLDDIGPLLQLYATDLANFLEILSNFYRWERPRKTAATLFVFVVCLLGTLVLDVKDCVNILWFLIGAAFFFAFPIGTRFPMYRFVTNPIYWIFWDIPTHAEMGIVQLQEKALVHDAELITQTEDTVSEFSDLDLPVQPLQKHQRYQFRASSDGSSGLLQITHSGIRFHSKDRGDTIIPFSHVREMQKWDTQSKKEKVLQPKAGLLVFLYDDGAGADGVHRLELKLDQNPRHQVFTLVLAWSNLKWQLLPMNQDRNTKKGESNFERSVKRVLI